MKKIETGHIHKAISYVLILFAGAFGIVLVMGANIAAVATEDGARALEEAAALSSSR